MCFERYKMAVPVAHMLSAELILETASKVKFEVAGEIGNPNLLCDKVLRYIC